MTVRNPNARRPTPICVGMRFGRWTVAAQSSPSKTGEKRWQCSCVCGGSAVIPASRLRRGTSQSCGCLMRERVAERNFRHGGKGTPEYVAWNAMVQRCTRESHPAWRNYGGRGITVCAEWRHDFAAFLAHIGPKPAPNLSLDRIDNDRGYEPGNVRWATTSQQHKNTRPKHRDTGGRFA